MEHSYTVRECQLYTHDGDIVVVRAMWQGRAAVAGRWCWVGVEFASKKFAVAEKSTDDGIGSAKSGIPRRAPRYHA